MRMLGKASIGGVLVIGLALSELMNGGAGERESAAGAQSSAAGMQVEASGAAARELGRLDAAISAGTSGSPAHLRLLEERAQVVRSGAVDEALQFAELCRIRAALATGTAGSPGYLRLWDQAEMLVVQAGESGC